MATPPAGSTVGVLGPADGLRDAIRDAGLTVLDETDEMDAADWVVTVGEPALVEFVDAGADRPVLPVGADLGTDSVPEAAAAGAIRAVAEGDAGVDCRLAVDVAVGDADWRALFDAFLVTDEPARISGFRVETGNRTVGRVRADGVVVATPTGSVGYASDAGGPVLAPGTGSLAVVPVAPFEIDAGHWVVPADGLSITVTRAEPASLVVDGRVRQTVGEGTVVRVAAGEPVSVLSVPESASRRGGQLEKH
jgi:NAD+ kinase